MESDLLKAAALLDEKSIKEIMLESSAPGSDDCCMMGVLNIYYIVYANYVLAKGTGFPTDGENAIRDQIEVKSKSILNFFESMYPINKALRDSGFLQWGSWMAEHPEDIEESFDSSEEVLLKAGFRKLDLDLWLACARYDLAEVRVLLARGGNPRVEIPYALTEDQLPLIKDYRQEYETDSAMWHAGRYSTDFFQCYDGFEYWKCSVENRDIKLEDSYISALIQSAAYQIIYNYLSGASISGVN